MEWKDIKKETPICFESGDWDGLRSELVLILSEGTPKVARMYEGYLDGSHFQDFCTEDDYEISDVTEWCSIVY